MDSTVLEMVNQLPFPGRDTLTDGNMHYIPEVVKVALLTDSWEEEM